MQWGMPSFVLMVELPTLEQELIRTRSSDNKIIRRHKGSRQQALQEPFAYRKSMIFS